MHHGRCAVHVRRREILGLRLHVCAFKVLDGGQRHGHPARRRAAIVGRGGQLLGVGCAVVLWMLVLLVVLLLLMLLDWRERRRTLHLWRGLLLRVLEEVVLLLLLVDNGRGRRRAMRRSRGLVVYYCWPACWVLVHGGDRDHLCGGGRLSALAQLFAAGI